MVRRVTVRRLVLGSLVALCAAVPATSAQAAEVTPAQAAALGQQAYLYGFPLLETLRVRATATSVRCADGRGNAPVNRFSTAERFATPADRTVVLPNVDTLYSLAQLDLGRGPVVLATRAWASATSSSSSSTLHERRRLRGHPHHRHQGGALRDHLDRPSRAARPRCAADRLGHAARLGRRPHAGGQPGRPAPRAEAHAPLRAAAPRRARPPGRGLRPSRAPCKPRHHADRPAVPRRAEQGAAPNPPPARDAPLLRRLATVGVGPGLRPTRAGLSADALRALVAGVDATAKALPTVAKSTVTSSAVAGQGWAIPRPIIGDYGTDYQYRAGVALLGLGANTQIESMYPTALTDAAGRRSTARRAYRLTFAPGQLPPARAFWSLTLYDGDGYLVPNPSAATRSARATRGSCAARTARSSSSSSATSRPRPA